MVKIINKIIEGNTLTLGEVARYCKEEGQGGLEMLQDLGYPIKEFSYENGTYKMVFKDDGIGFDLDESKD